MHTDTVQTVSLKKRHRNESNPQKILEITLELMSTHGYAGTSISKISELSGYPVTSIYWHFGSKEKLLLAALEYGAIEHLNSRLLSIPQSINDIESHLELIDAEFLMNPPKVMRMMFMIGLENDGRNPNIQKSIRLIREHGRKILIQHIKGLAAQQGALLSDNQTLAIADIALAIADGFILANQLEPGKVDIYLGSKMFVKTINLLIKEHKK